MQNQDTKLKDPDLIIKNNIAANAKTRYEIATTIIGGAGGYATATKFAAELAVYGVPFGPQGIVAGAVVGAMAGYGAGGLVAKAHNWAFGNDNIAQEFIEEIKKRDRVIESKENNNQRLNEVLVNNHNNLDRANRTIAANMAHIKNSNTQLQQQLSDSQAINIQLKSEMEKKVQDIVSLFSEKMDEYKKEISKEIDELKADKRESRVLISKLIDDNVELEKWVSGERKVSYTNRVSNNNSSKDNLQPQSQDAQTWQSKIVKDNYSQNFQTKS